MRARTVGIVVAALVSIGLVIALVVLAVKRKTSTTSTGTPAVVVQQTATDYVVTEEVAPPPSNPAQPGPGEPPPKPKPQAPKPPPAPPAAPPVPAPGNPDASVVPITFEGEQADTAVQLQAGGQNVQFYNFVYGVTRNEGTATFNTSYAWFAGNGAPVACRLTMTGRWAPSERAYVGSGGTSIPYTREGNTLTFILPKPNCYFVKPNVFKQDITTSPETIHIYYDPATVLTPPPGATVIKRGTHTFDSFDVKGTVFLESGTVIRGKSGDRFVRFSDNSTLVGAGIIDTNNGYRNICDIAATNVTVTGPMLRKSQAFGYVVSGTNVTSKHVKIFSGVDGADPISVNGYSMSFSVVVAPDDSWACKSNRGRPCRNVTVTECIATSRKSALKLGTESPGDYNNIVFDKVTIYDGCRFISLYSIDGALASGVIFRNCIGFLVKWPGEGRSGRWIDSDGAAVATVKRTAQNSPLTALIEGCFVRGITGSLITPTGSPTRLTIKNTTLIGTNIMNKARGEFGEVELAVENVKQGTEDVWPIPQ